jgi:osmotically-inducible protein OsmY
MDQGGDESDRKITADIRKRVMDAKLSVDAQNAKIVTQGGRVTLRGPVSTQAEKDTIGRIAGEVAGVTNVDNQLEVAVVAR